MYRTLENPKFRIKCLWNPENVAKLLPVWKVGWLCWGLTSQSTIFQSYRDGAIASWVINQYFRGVKCLAQGHNTAAVGLEPRTSRSGVRHSTTEPPRSPLSERSRLTPAILQKTFVCCTSTYPLLTPLPKTFLALLEFFFLPHFFYQKIMIFSLCKMKKKKNICNFFPYLPNQPKIQSRGTANKQFFKNGLMYHF